jgi:hypothetical protein
MNSIHLILNFGLIFTVSFVSFSFVLASLSIVFLSTTVFIMTVVSWFFPPKEETTFSPSIEKELKDFVFSWFYWFFPLTQPIKDPVLLIEKHLEALDRHWSNRIRGARGWDIVLLLRGYLDVRKREVNQMYFAAERDLKRLEHVVNCNNGLLRRIRGLWRSRERDFRVFQDFKNKLRAHQRNEQQIRLQISAIVHAQVNALRQLQPLRQLPYIVVPIEAEHTARLVFNFNQGLPTISQHQGLEAFSTNMPNSLEDSLELAASIPNLPLSPFGPRSLCEPLPWLDLAVRTPDPFWRPLQWLDLAIQNPITIETLRQAAELTGPSFYL